MHTPAGEYADEHADANADRLIDEHSNAHADTDSEQCVTDRDSEQYNADGDTNSVFQPYTPPAADRPTLPTRLVEARRGQGAVTRARAQ